MSRPVLLRTVASVLLAAVAAVWVVGGLQRVEIGSGVDSLLPRNDDSVVDIETLAKDFGGDPVVVLLETEDPAGLVRAESMPALLQLEGALAGLPDVAVAYGPATTLNQSVIRIKRMLAEISGTRDALADLDRTQQLERFEKRYGSLLVEGLPAGLPTLRNDKFVQAVVFDQSGDAKPQWSQYVPEHSTVAVYLRPREGLDLAASERLRDAIDNLVDQSELTGPGVRATVSGSPMVTGGLADELRGEVPKLGAFALGAVAAVLLVAPWSVRRSRRLLPLVPMCVATLITVAGFGWLDRPLTVGAATLLPVLLGLGSYYPIYLAQSRHRRLVLSVAGAASVSFLTLVESPLPFVRDLGLAIPAGIATAVALSLFGGWLRGTRAEPDTTPVDPPEAPARAVDRRAGFVLLGLVGALAAVGWSLLPGIEVRSDPQDLVRGLPELADAQHVEEVLGYSAEVDVVLRGDDVMTPAGLSWLRRAQEGVVVAHGDKVRPVASASDVLAFLGPRPTQAQIDAGLDLVPRYVSGAVVTSDRTTAMVSLGAEWDALSEHDGVLQGIEDALPEPPAGHQVEVVGTPVAAERGYQLVSGNRYRTNLAGIVAAGVFLAVGLRRRRDALLAVLAATLATGLGLLVADVSGAGLNPLTLALGSLTAAIGCEFTVLLAEARRLADTRLRNSVFLAASLSAAGYAALMMSSLPIIREFGLALTMSVALSLVAALAVVHVFQRSRPAVADRSTLPVGTGRTRSLVTSGVTS